MHRITVIGCSSILVLMAFPCLAFAGVPCAGTSTVTAAGDGECAPHATVCPGGDMDTVRVSITVRDCYGTPLPGLMVTVYPTAASTINLRFCIGEESKAVGPTDVTGYTQADFAGFGGCDYLSFEALVSGVILGPSPAIHIASPDYVQDWQAPMCIVDLVDFSWFAKSFLTNDPCWDYNCDGQVNLLDFGRFAQHFLDNCPCPVREASEG